MLSESQARAPVHKSPKSPLLAGAVFGSVAQDGSCRDAVCVLHAKLVQTVSSAGAGVQTGSSVPDEKSRCSPNSGHAEREPYKFDMFQQALHQSNFSFIALSLQF